MGAGTGQSLRCWMLAGIATSACGRIGFGPHELGTADGDVADAAADATASSGRVALVQSTSGWSDTRVTSRSVPLPMAPAAGDLVIVAVSTSFTAPVSVTDNAGNSYEGVPSNPTANSPTYCNILTYYARNVTTVAGFAATVSVASGDDFLSVVVVELAGADPVLPLAADVRTAGTSASPAAGPIQSTRDGALYFTLLCHNATRTTTMGSDFQVLQVPTEAGSTNSAMVTAYKLGDAVPTSAAATMSGSDSWQMSLAAFE